MFSFHFLISSLITSQQPHGHVSCVVLCHCIVEFVECFKCRDVYFVSCNLAIPNVGWCYGDNLFKNRFFSHFMCGVFMCLCAVYYVWCVSVCVLVCSVLCVCHVGNVEAVSGRGGCGSGSLQPGHTSGQHHIRPVTSRQPAASPEGRPSPASAR